MPRATITNVTAGILSDKMLGRADLQRYLNACLRIDNYQVDPTGEWGARMALVYCGTRKHNDKASIPVEFHFSTTQSYILEMGHAYMRVWKDGGIVLDGPNPYELAMPYQEADLAGLWWTQSADVLYLLHEKYEPRQLTRLDHNNWTISIFELQDGPYLKENTNSAWGLSATGTSGAIVVNATGAGNAPFTGRNRSLIRWPNGGGAWTWLRVTAVNSATQVQATVMGAAMSGTTASNYRLSVYHDNNWPTTGRLMDGRLIFGGAAKGLDRSDGSATADYPKFTPGANDADAFSWTLASQQVDRIMSYASAGELVVLTAGSLWRMSGANERSAITPNGVSAKKLSGHGATSIPPVEATDAVVWIDRSKRKLLRLQLNPDGLQGWAVNDLTVLSDNMAGRRRNKAGFVSLAWQPDPKPTIWALRQDGIVAALTYLPEEKVNAFWTLSTFAGDEIEGWRVIPGPNGSAEAYAFVKRVIAGQTVRTVERFEWDNLLRSPAEQKRLDCCITYDQPEELALTLGATTGNNVTATVAVDTFVAGHVGREIRQCVEDYVDDDDNVVWRWCVGRIVSIDSPKVARVKILADFKDTVLAAGEWRLTVREVTGADLFNGDTVSAQLDGQPVHGLPVVDGKVELPYPASIVHIGRRYSARLLTMPIDVGSPPGTGQGRPARVDRVMIRVRDSIGGKIGAWKKGAETRWAKTGLLSWDWAAGKPPLPVSEDVSINTAGDWTTRPMVIVEQDEPLPHNVQLLNPNIYAPWVDV